MLDPYANYMFQTLAQSCSSEQRYVLLQKVNFFVTSNVQIKSFSIQIDCPSYAKSSLWSKGHPLASSTHFNYQSRWRREADRRETEWPCVDAFKGTIVIRMRVLIFCSGSASHSLYSETREFDFSGAYRFHIQRCGSRVPWLGQPFLRALRGNISIINNLRQWLGNFQLKALITKIQKQEDKKWLIIQLVSENVDNLIQNPYGNYAIQHTFEVNPLYGLTLVVNHKHLCH